MHLFVLLPVAVAVRIGRGNLVLRVRDRLGEIEEEGLVAGGVGVLVDELQGEVGEQVVRVLLLLAALVAGQRALLFVVSDKIGVVGVGLF
jgi:hypothetical protein